MDRSDSYATSEKTENDAQKEHKNGRQNCNNQPRRHVLGVCGYREHAQNNSGTRR